MSDLGNFFLEFMKPFFGGLLAIGEGIISGLWKMLNIVNYYNVIIKYKESLSGFGIVILIINIISILLLYALLVYGIYVVVKRIIKFRKNMRKEEELIDEIEKLNTQVYKLKATNDKFIASLEEEENSEVDENGNVVKKESRFFKLSQIDEQMVGYQQTPGNNTINLKDFCASFRNFAASRLGLYYTDKMIRLFIAAFASNRLIILEGISGTGKTSLAYAFGQMVKNESAIASVQPSWRDSSELFGYFNEFTKKFNESEVLRNMYLAKYKDDIFVTILDEMNISRVEYYFAEMLSILELPSQDEWIIELVPNGWENDPKLLDNGKIKVPNNMWYVGTINNDDSTFMVTDKVYDRAMPIEINDKCEPFSAPDTEPIKLTSDYFQSLFAQSEKDYPIDESMANNLEQLDKYIIAHFRISFGNRILKQMYQFVPAYVACGGDEIEAIDYVVAHKILRKFEQLNFSLIKNEIDGLIEFLNNTYGQDKMTECIEYLERLKRQYR